MAKWAVVQEQADIRLMSETLKISEVTAQVLVNRGIRTKNTALRFLYPEMELLHDGLLMMGMDKAVGIAADSIARGEKIIVFGDYDVDGVTSCVILYKTLISLGADADYYIPHRESEGYGFTMDSVEKLSELGARLIITCDNGVASIDEAAEARRRGIKLVILDHHEPRFTEKEDGEREYLAPEADALVDPKFLADTYPFKALCAAGIAYKFSEALHRRCGAPFDGGREFLVLAMLATFCDIVDLQGENRIIAKQGLKALNEDRAVNLGLYALMEEKGLSGRDIGGYFVGFIIGPCINATGRLHRATDAVRLFTTQDGREAAGLAQKLSELNEIRKDMTACAFERADAIVENEGLDSDSVIVVFDPETHESVAGIVAGRLRERYHRPAIVLTPGGGALKGSGRSIECYNMFEALYANRELLPRFGGHAMAAGLSIMPENVDVLRAALNGSCGLTEEDFVNTVSIDGVLTLRQVTFELARELQALEPFGKANTQPLFMTEGLVPCALRVIAEKDMLIFTFKTEGGRSIKGLCFGFVERFEQRLDELCGRYGREKIMNGVLRNANFCMDIVYAVEINEYNGDVSVQMKIKDFMLRGA